MLNQAATFSTPIVEFKRPLLYNVSGKCKGSAEIFISCPQTGAHNVMSCITADTGMCLVSVT